MPESKPYYRKATVRDALNVVANIRPEDKQEIEGLGHNPLALVWCVENSSDAVAFFTEGGAIGGVAGIVPDPRPGIGQVWMICTPSLEKNPHTFVRQARKWLAGVGKDYQMLWNQMDARNDVHHKLVRLLGFKMLRLVYPPPYNHPYIEIVKLCASQQPPSQRHPLPFQPSER